MGITDIFSTKADLSAMTENLREGTFVSDVIRKAFVEVNEEDTEAAAATAVMMRLMCMPKEPMVFKADHPSCSTSEKILLELSCSLDASPNHIYNRTYYTFQVDKG
ncbi:serpin B6-like [Saccostrea cucullata]|uniref:serpin B6-like n=1 Tax=Saccostrea cuccullata TaxID=36930 RepID=UPI002ED55259